MLLYKKGSRKDPRNYRGINVNRFAAKIIHNQLQKASKHIISDNENGFSPDREGINM